MNFSSIQIYKKMLPTNLNDPEFVTASWELVDQVLSDTIQHVKNSPQTTAI